MIKLYLKQAWTLIKQNKLFTSIYVVGTGLSIALIHDYVHYLLCEICSDLSGIQPR